MIINDRYYLSDIESGEVYEVSKEQYEDFQEMWDDCRAILKDKNIGKPIVFGTGGIDFRAKDFEDMFYNPQNYRIIKFE